MAGDNRKANAMAFLTVGLCLAGAGVVMGAALMRRGAAVTVLVLVASGVCFVAIGLAKRRAA